MSRRNPTKAQRKIIFELMQKGKSYEQACMTLPESESKPEGGKMINPSETNTPKIKRIITIYHGQGVDTKKEVKTRII